MRINDGGSSSPTIIRYATTEAAVATFLQICIVDALREYLYVLSVMQLMLLVLIPKN